MGHLLFIVMHLMAALIFAWLLFLTIPLHLIYAATKSRGSRPSADSPGPDTHVRCPDCRELVRMDAIKCKHCGTALVPLTPGAQASGAIDIKAAVVSVIAVVVMLAALGAISAWVR